MDKISNVTVIPKKYCISVYNRCNLIYFMIFDGRAILVSVLKIFLWVLVSGRELVV